MSNIIKRPEDFLRPGDRTIVWGAAFVACLTLIAIPVLPYTTSPLNEWLRQVFPFQVAILFLVVPFAIYHALRLNQQIKFNDILRHHHRDDGSRAYGKVSFLAQMRAVAEGGTEWRIRNANEFDWTNAHVMLELSSDGTVTTEKHKLNDVKSQVELRLLSRLPLSPNGQWRVMVITEQGRLIDFPDRWVEFKEIPIPRPAAPQAAPSASLPTAEENVHQLEYRA